MLPRAAPAQLETKIERFVINKLLKNTDRVDNEIFPIDKVIPSYFRHLRTNKLTPSKARRPAPQTPPTSRRSALAHLSCAQHARMGRCRLRALQA